MLGAWFVRILGPLEQVKWWAGARLAAGGGWNPQAQPRRCKAPNVLACFHHVQAGVVEHCEHSASHARWA
jgi:hypothetical protein